MGCLRGYLSSEKGTASLEFVVILPLLLGILVLAAEFGEALTKREALDSALSDALFLIASAPVQDSSAVAGCPFTVPDYYINLAKDIVATRTNVPQELVSFEVCLRDNTAPAAVLAQYPEYEFYPIEVAASVIVDLPLLSIIDAFDGPEGGLSSNLTVDFEGSSYTGLKLYAHDTFNQIANRDDDFACLLFNPNGCP